MKKLHLQHHAVASNDDLLIEILLRLPIKSLIRFQSVSKHWVSLITAPQFRNRLNSYSSSSAVGLFFINENRWRYSSAQGSDKYDYICFFPQQLESKNNRPTLDFGFATQPSRTGVADSCNGLLLCSNRNHYVYNPTTNQSLQLPQMDDGRSEVYTVWSLAFDPLKSFHYSVVCVRRFYNDPGNYQIHVYSSESGAWKLAAEINRLKSAVCFHEGIRLLERVYWNGSIHWISNRPETYSLRFSVEHQKLEEMPTPPGQHSGGCFGNYFHLGQSCDHLHCVQYSGHTIVFDVYEMKRDYSEWFVKYRVDLASLLEAYPSILVDDYGTDIYCYSIFCIVRGEHEKGSFLVLQTYEKAIKYNLDDQTFEGIYEIEGPIKLIGTKGIPYIELHCWVG